MTPNVHSSENCLDGEISVPSASLVTTPPKTISREPLPDFPGWPSFTDSSSTAPGGSRHDGSLDRTKLQSSGVQLPTPQSPATVSSYLLSETEPLVSAAHTRQPSTLPSEFCVYTTPSPLQSQRTLTPESSPLSMHYQVDGSNSQPQSSVLMDAHGQQMVPSVEPTKIAMCELLPTGCTATLGETPLGVRASGEHPTSINNSVDDAEFPHTPPLESPVSVPRCVDGGGQLLPQQGNVAVVDTEAGENLVRIRAQLAEKRFILAKEAEARRPDYFKRMRRAARVTDGTSQDPVLQPTAPIGITDSPAKGRCLTLFQETSEESFEESLMAGGYGRYRSDALPWRKPESEVPSVVDVTEDPTPMVERERKKKRLAAFRNVPVASSSKTQLVPTEIEGCGRVLICMDAAEPPTSPKRSPSKGRRSRRKKKVAADGRGGMNGLLAPSEAKVDAPNWPDMHFPWGSTSMPGESQDLEEERLRHIENFLTRDSDEEAEEGSCSPLRSSAEEMQWTQGKTYPALRHTEETTQVGSIARSVILNDPADARVALLSKRSVKELSLRLLRRRNTDNDGDGGEVVCICNEPDDERGSVQCDACQIWYHLDCIGIRSTSELGREEDPWFCANCAETRTPPPVVLSLSEPTFVPTDDKIIGDAGYDLPFLQAGFNPSPTTHWTSSVRPPKTPPGSHVGFQFSSGSSLDEPASRGGPHTPQFPGSHDARVYTTPGQQVGLLTLEESPFDPTSTPSRGIKFGAPFATPKNGLWQGRQQELFHTPTRPGGIGLGRHFGQYGSWGVEQSAGGSAHAQDITPVVHHLNERGRPLESPLAGKRSRHSVDNRLSRSRGS